MQRAKMGGKEKYLKFLVEDSLNTNIDKN